MPDILLAGVARAIITPPIGIRMQGYTVQEGTSEGVERELTATALVLSALGQKAAILACDLLFIQSPHVDRIRERIGQRLAMPASHVLINCSHTHLGPMLPGWNPREPEGQQRKQERYLAWLEEVLVGVAAMANSRRQPARLAAARGFAELGMNRREQVPHEGVIIGENPRGAVDNSVTVLRLDELDGRPLATLMSAACHTVVLGPKTLTLSPDFVGPAREIVERATGALSLYLQGPAGNVNPVCGIGGGGPDQQDDLERLGAVLAGETIKLWAGLRTHHRRGERRIVRSVAAISVWDYEPLPEESIDFFGVACQRRTMPLAPLPTPEAAEQYVAAARQRLDEAHIPHNSLGRYNVENRLADWVALVRQAAASPQPITRDLECWGLRVNDIGIVAVNGEPFAELGLEVKHRSPLAHTLFLGYSNGCLGYLPTPAAFDEGGMEVDQSVRNYLLPAPFTRAWGPAVIDLSLAVLGQLQ